MFRALLAMILVASPATALELEPLTGAWKGQGWVQPSEAGREVLRCRLDGQLISEDQIDFNGLCATPSASGAFWFAVAFNEDQSRVALRLRSDAFSEALDVSGDWQDNRAELAGELDDGQRYRIAIALEAQNRFTLAIFSDDETGQSQRFFTSFSR